MSSTEGNGDPARIVSRERTVELLKRFDRPGPRYTSYPTAVEFHEGVGPDDAERCLKVANEAGDKPLSVYVHLPFCDERCLFCGCHVIISPHKERALPYMDLLCREFDLVAERLPDRRKVSLLHLGGGTPTYQPPDQLDLVLTRFFQQFEATDDAELAVEVDPRVTTDAHLDVLAKHGFNRISLGVQDFTPKVQEAIGRVQSVEQTSRVIDSARARGFRGINIDLIYGLPFQEAGAFEETVETALGLQPDRTAVYSFAFVPWIRQHMTRITEDDLPSPEEKFNLFALTRECFLKAGYEPIGMDHFARPDDELAKARKEGRLRRNFQGYTVIPAEDVLGLGISAIGDLSGAYLQNQKKLSRYEEAIQGGVLPVERGVLCSSDDQARRAIIHQLMCNFRVDIPEVEERHGLDFGTTFEADLERMQPLVEDGLVEVNDKAIQATPTGELFIRNVGLCFDSYFWDKHHDGDKPVFSRTV